MKTDGSVIIDTKIVDGGMEKGFEAIKKEMSSVGIAAEDLGDKLKLSLSKGASAPIQEAFSKLKDLEAKFNGMDLSYKKELKISEKLKAELSEVEEILSGGGTDYISPDVYIDAYTKKDELSASIESQNAQVKALETQIKATYASLESARKRLATVVVQEAQKEANAEEKAAQKALKEKERAYKQATKSMRAFGKRLTSIVSGALVFNVISKGLRKITESFGTVLKSNQKFSSSWSKLKQSVSDAIYPIVEVLAPVLSGVLDIATNLVKMIGDAFSLLSGKSTEQIKENNKNVEKTKKQLASFDEINTLKSDSAEDGKTSTPIEDNTSLSGAVKDSQTIADCWERTANSGKAFAYDVVGKLDVTTVENFSTATDNLKSGWENLLRTFSSGDTDLSGAVAGAVNFRLSYMAAEDKLLGGILDFWAEARKVVASGGNPLLSILEEDNDMWDALGEIGASFGMAILATFPKKGLFGVTKKDMENLFLPVTEEYTNLYRGLSTEASEALDNYSQTFDKLKDKTKELDWGDAIISNEDVAAIKSLSDQTYSVIVKNNEKAKETAKSSLATLLEQELITEQQYKDGLASIETTFSEQETMVQNNQAEILRIMQTAKDEKRALTDSENQTIQSLLDQNNKTTVGIISKGAADASDVYAIMQANKDKWNKQMLSETIQYANKEYDAQVSAANKTYEDTIAAAETSYYQLGTINETEFNEIKKNAKDKKDAQIKAAEETRTKLVSEAQGMNADVAKAVDPETGEILSNWEVLWNSMKEKVRNKVEEIKTAVKNAINAIIGFFNAPSDKLNEWFGGISGKKILGVKIPEISFPKIPELAKGAVIPPNREFLALLGDQKSGTNVEAPLDTIKQALAEVLAVQGGAGSETVVSVNFTGDLAQLARVLKPAIDTETRRKGSSLATGGMY